MAFLATWHTYIVLHETYWRCMDIVYASRKMPSMEGKFDFFHGRYKAHTYCLRSVLDPFLSRALSRSLCMTMLVKRLADESIKDFFSSLSFLDLM